MYILAPPSSETTVEFIHALSRLLGWSYVFCWSVSFYPQAITNYRRRSVTGLALDYFIVNVLGFTCYTISSVLFLYSPTVRGEYARRHPLSPEPTVRLNDLAFAVSVLYVETETKRESVLTEQTGPRNAGQYRDFVAVLVLAV